MKSFSNFLNDTIENIKSNIQFKIKYTLCMLINAIYASYYTPFMKKEEIDLNNDFSIFNNNNNYIRKENTVLDDLNNSYVYPNNLIIKDKKYIIGVLYQDKIFLLNNTNDYEAYLLPIKKENKKTNNKRNELNTSEDDKFKNIDYLLYDKNNESLNMIFSSITLQIKMNI